MLTAGGCSIYSMGITLLQVLTGRAVSWKEGRDTVYNFMFCRDHAQSIAQVIDGKANWPVEVAKAVYELAETMIENGRSRHRPTTTECIEELKRLRNMA